MQGPDETPGEIDGAAANDRLAGPGPKVSAGRDWTARMAWTGALVGAYTGFALVMFYSRESSLPALSHLVAFSAPAGLLLLLLKPGEGRWLLPFLAAHLFLSIALLAADSGAVEIVVLLVLALDALLIVRLSGNRTKPNLQAFRRAVLGSVTLSTVIVTGALIATAATVAMRAEQIAAGRPYCITVARNESYHLASSFADLSVFQMRNRHRYRDWRYYAYHGVLMVEVNVQDDPFDYYNWSYQNMNFDFRPSHTDFNLPGPSKCLPSPHFVHNLPLF